MESEKPFKAEKDPQSLLLEQFFMDQVLPYLSEDDRDFIESMRGVSFSEDELQKWYTEFSEYDPASDGGKDFYTSVFLPFYIFVTSEDCSAFADVKESFVEKVKAFAEILYRDAFFRNSYDSLAAWESCRKFKLDQALFDNLNVLPDGAKERIAGMSKELDSLWSQPEMERAFNNSVADGYVATGSKEGSMLVQMYREDSKPIPEAEYAGYHESRPDLFPQKYEEYIQELEKPHHPYVLKL